MEEEFGKTIETLARDSNRPLDRRHGRQMVMMMMMYGTHEKSLLAELIATCEHHCMTSHKAADHDLEDCCVQGKTERRCR